MYDSYLSPGKQEKRFSCRHIGKQSIGNNCGFQRCLRFSDLKKVDEFTIRFYDIKEMEHTINLVYDILRSTNLNLTEKILELKILLDEHLLDEPTRYKIGEEIEKIEQQIIEQEEVALAAAAAATTAAALAAEVVAEMIEDEEEGIEAGLDDELLQEENQRLLEAEERRMLGFGDEVLGVCGESNYDQGISRVGNQYRIGPSGAFRVEEPPQVNPILNRVRGTRRTFSQAPLQRGDNTFQVDPSLLELPQNQQGINPYYQANPPEDYRMLREGRGNFQLPTPPENSFVIEPQVTQRGKMMESLLPLITPSVNAPLLKQNELGRTKTRKRNKRRKRSIKKSKKKNNRKKYY